MYTPKYLAKGIINTNLKVLFLQYYYDFYQKLNGPESVRVFKTKPTFTDKKSELNILDKLDYNLKYAFKAVEKMEQDPKMNVTLLTNENEEMVAFSRSFLQEENDKEILVIPEIILCTKNDEENIYGSFLDLYQGIARENNVTELSIEVPSSDIFKQNIALAKGYTYDPKLNKSEGEKTFIMICPTLKKENDNEQAFSR